MSIAVSSVVNLLECIRKSQLVDEARLAAFMHTVTPPVDEPKALAERMVRSGLLTAFQAGYLLKGKHKGFFIAGKYRLLDLIGSGGMGRVFLCEHVRMRRWVALKMLPQAQAKNPSSLERFDREARAVAALKHPNIVQAYDIDDDNSNHFLVMEYVDGISLQALADRFGPLDPVRGANYLSQAAAGLQHAHETAGLIHRDLKPGNLLLDREGYIKLLDLGLAKFFYDTQDNLTHRYDEKAVLGTADFLSPEQAINSREVDIRADIYSLGATFYYVLSGKKPLGDGNVAQKLVWSQTKDPLPLEQLQPEVPIELADVIHRMMAKDPADRFQYPYEIIGALTPFTALRVPAPPDHEMPTRRPPGTDMSRSSARLAGPRSGRMSGPTSGRYQGPLTGSIPQSQASVETPSPSAGQTGRIDEDSERLVPPQLEYMRRQRRFAYLAIGSLSAVLMLMIGWIWWPANKPVPVVMEQNNSRGEPMTWVVTSLRVPNAVATLTEALQRAQPNDTIVIAQSPLRESVTISPEMGYRGPLRIIGESPDMLPIIWHSTQDNLPALRIQGATQLQIENIQFNGEGRINDLISVEGTCSGMHFHHIELTGFQRTALRLSQAQGASSPLRFQHLIVRDGAPDATAILLEAPTGTECCEIQISHSRFVGPGQTWVSVQGSVNRVHLHDNRVTQWKTGLQYRPLSDTAFLDARIDNNTFHHVQTLIELSDAPPTPQHHPLRWTHNLIIESPTWVALKRGTLDAEPVWLEQGASNGHNQVDARDETGITLLGGRPVDTTTVSLDPKSATFLLTRPGSRLAQMGLGATE